MTPTFKLNADGSLDVRHALGTNADGTPAERTWCIGRDAIAAHRRDPDFDAALPADIKAALDAPPAKK